MITHDIDLCLGMENQGTSITVKCCDTGVNIRAHLFVCRLGKWRDTHEPYIIPEECTPVIKIAKPDKTFFVKDGIVQGDGVLFETKPQAFTAAGTAKAEVSLFADNGERITTATFDINIPAECTSKCEGESGDYVDVMSAQIRVAIEAADRAEDAAKRAENATDPAEIDRIVNEYLAENPPATGPAGPQGEKGEPGERGPQGESGKDGADGKDGVDGKDAPQIDDTKISTSNPWSSRNIVDKLCPSFTESGSVVSCTPVEGYPLGVEWKKKNLADPALIEDFFTGTNIRYAYTKGMLLPKGTYTATVIADISNVGNFNIRRHDDKTIIVSGGEDPITFTLTEPTAICWNVNLGEPVTADNYKSALRIQIEEGTTATAYEPYAETATIYCGGKNLIVYPFPETTKTLNGLTFTDNGDGTITIDGTASAGTTFNLAAWTKWGLKHGATYTASVSRASGSYTGNVPNLTVNYYAVGATNYSAWLSVTVTSSKTGVCPSDLNSLRSYLYVPQGTVCNSLVMRPQLEEGTTATEYEPYKEVESFAIGEPITALKGVNTIYADKGLVTVTGKADPSAEIEKLKNAILSLGGNM